MPEELAKQQSYAIARVEKEQLATVLRDNVGPRGLSEFDLDRIHVPAGGGDIWHLPTLTEDSENIKSFRGVIVHYKDSRAFWRQDLDEHAPEPPQCFSDDGYVGHGDPGGVCDKCPEAVFGSGKTGGQACRQARLLFVLRPNKLLPCVVSVAPTSLAGARRYFLRLASEMLAYHQVETTFGLAEARNKKGVKYSQITFAAARVLDENEKELVAAYRTELLPRIASVRSTKNDFREEEEEE